MSMLDPMLAATISRRRMIVVAQWFVRGDRVPEDRDAVGGKGLHG